MIIREKFRYDLLNRDDLVIGTVDCEDGSVKHSSLATIKRTGSFTIRENELQDIDYLNDRIRPVMLLWEDGQWKEYPLGVYMIPSPKRATRNNGVYRNIEAYDPTLILEQDKFLRRIFFKKGMKYTDVIRQIIHSANIFKVNIIDSEAALNRDREFEIATTKIQAVNELLKEINYTSLYTDGMGFFMARPYLIPSMRDIDKTYKNDEFSFIIPNTMTDEIDTFNVKNIFLVTSSNPESETLKSVYVNDNPSSETSTVRTGRNNVDDLIVNDIADQVTLDNFTHRRAYDASDVYQKSEFETIKIPTHGYSDVIYLEHDVLGIKGKYIETSWEMSLSIDSRMRHAVRRVIHI